MNNELKNISNMGMEELAHVGVNVKYAIQFCQKSLEAVLAVVSNERSERFCGQTSEQVMMAIQTIQTEYQQNMIQIELAEARLKRERLA